MKKLKNSNYIMLIALKIKAKFIHRYLNYIGFNFLGHATRALVKNTKEAIFTLKTTLFLLSKH
jgi:hypothetical protein